MVAYFLTYRKVSLDSNQDFWPSQSIELTGGSDKHQARLYGGPYCSNGESEVTCSLFRLTARVSGAELVHYMG